MSALWHEIKLDKRLAHRGQPGIRAHILAMVSRVSTRSILSHHVLTLSSNGSRNSA